MAEKEKKEVAKKEDAGLPSRVSGKGGVAAGYEEVDMQQDILMPRVAILQGTSQMVLDGKGKVGELADSLSKESFGIEFTFMPLYCFKTRCKFKLSEGLVCQSRNALTCSMNMDQTHQVGVSCIECPDAQWPLNAVEGGPKCSLVYNFPAINADAPMSFPIALSLMKTSSKAGKKLISLAMRTGEDMFARKYKLITTMQTNDKGTFAVADIELAGKVTDEEYAIAKKWFTALRAKVVDVDLKGEAPSFDE